MERIAIIGGGFAGTAAAERLSNSRHEVHLFDPGTGFDFLPLLPDLVGERYSFASVVQGYAAMAERLGFRYRAQRAVSVDPDARSVTTEAGTEGYDRLLIAAGAGTAWHGDEIARHSALPLRSAEEAAAVAARLSGGEYENAVVVGGGYTGLEAATQILRLSRARGLGIAVTIVELADRILPGGEAWMRRYLGRRLDGLAIRVLCGTGVAEYDGKRLVLSDGSVLERALAVWTAGAEPAAAAVTVGAETDDRGRLIVDACLRLADGCYAAGDCVRVDAGDGTLPMASYLAIQQGRRAAGNILREIAGKPPRPYRPRYYGFVIPLADGRGCGRLLGLPIRGRAAALVHHGAALLRTRSRQTRLSIIRELLKEGFGMPRRPGRQ